ncbi:A kinase anchor protein [Entamoeba marina]
MSYQRCGIVADKDICSRYYEIKTDRTSYLQGDVVLVTVNAKMNQTPSYNKLYILVSCVGNISRTVKDQTLPPSPKTQTKTYFEIKNEFTSQNYPLSYSFTIPNTSPFSGSEGSFHLPQPLSHNQFVVNASHCYRIDLFVELDSKTYLADQKDIVVRQTFNELQPLMSLSFDNEYFKLKILSDKPAYYPKEYQLLWFEVNSKISRPTSVVKVVLNQLLELNFDDSKVQISKIIDTYNVVPFQPYYYGKRPLVIKLPEHLPPSHSSPLIKLEYSIIVTFNAVFESGSTSPYHGIMKETILASPMLYNSSPYLPLITYDFETPTEKILRPFWQEDKSTDVCGICKSSFGIITRRHHCRRCGKVFCGGCCKENVLMKNLGFDKPERVCANCYKIEKQQS